MKQEIGPHIVQWFQDSLNLRVAILQNKEFLSEIEQGAKIIVQALRDQKKILLCGNGGSAADAQHIAAEFVVRYKGSNDRPAIPALALTTDTSILTACANDYSYDDIFSRQIEALGQPGDVLIGLSTSGNSGNVIRAVQAAQSKQMSIIKLLGGSGGKLQNMDGANITVPASVTARIQEVHITIGHIFCEWVDMDIYGFSA